MSDTPIAKLEQLTPTIQMIQMIPEIFGSTVCTHAHRVAIDIPPGTGRPSRQTCTYAQLDQKSRAIALAIAADLWGRHEPIVAVLLPRDTANLYAAQLGVHRASGAFTCLDLNFPDDHIRSIIRDSDSPVILTDSIGRARIERAGLAPNQRIIDVGSILDDGRTNETARPTDPHSLAYVIYTSGTTGAPKGVMIEHRSIANLVRSDIPRFGLDHTDRVAQCSSAAYDSSLEETWLAFAVGATLVLIDDETIRLGPDLVDWINRESITVLCPPPTLLRTLGCANPQRELPLVKLLYVGGEALPQDLADSWSRGRRLENGYGPTECTVTVVRTQIVAGVPVTIGQPVEGHTAHILDESLDEVAPSGPGRGEGELCIAGIGLARGYRNLPLVTAEKFIDHPKFGRIYRTGDLVRRTAPGDIEYLGRIDGQIKLRGYRVELSAIDSILAQHDSVREAACRVQGEGAARIVVAHVVLLDSITAPPWDDIRDSVRRSLPSYMIPSRFVTIDALPRTVGGKIDRIRLPEVDAPNTSHVRTDETHTPQEAIIVHAMANALARESSISIDADFFVDLGGDSLSAVGVICALRAKPSTASLTVRDIYECRSVRNLSHRLGERLTTAPTQEPRVRAGTRANDPTLAAIVQCLVLAAMLVASGSIAYLLIFELMPMLVAEWGISWTIAITPIFSMIGIVVYSAFAVAMTVILKRVLIGHARAETFPVFSAPFIRHWIVQQSARTIPWGLIEGTVIVSAVLRLLGARIGERVHIHRGVDLFRGGWDLLAIGDDVTLSQEATLDLLLLRDGQLSVGPVTIGDRCTVDVRAGVGQGARMESGSSLAPLSHLCNGARIPAGELWDGVPAKRTGFAHEHEHDQARDPRGTNLNPHWHAFLMIASHFGFGLISALSWMVIAWLVAPRFESTDPKVIAVLLLIGTPLAVMTTLFAQALGVRALGRTKSGQINRWSQEFITIWAKTHAVDSAGRWLSGSLFWPIWLRIAGMRVGRGCEISTIIDVLPDTVTIGDGCFFADGIYFVSPRIHRGVVTVEHTSLAENTFIGNHAVITAGHSYGKDLFIGVSTVANGMLSPAGSSWFGHPAMELPRREVVSIDRTLTHNPSALRWTNRVLWELARFALPLFPIAVGLGWWGAIDLAQTYWSPLAVALFVAPSATIAACLTMIGAIIAMKWVLLGRVRPGQHAFWSCWCSRWDLLFVAWGFYARRILDGIEGTILLTWFLRCIGVRIGRRVVLGRGFTQVVDPDMLTIDDDATVNCNFQAHSFEDRILKIDYVHIGAGATVGRHAVLFYGVHIGTGALVTPHSVVMKREQIETGSIYSGCPASRLNF